MDDELRQRRVERLIRERQLLGGRLLHPDPRMALPGSCDKRLGGIDGRHSRRPNPFDQLGRQRSGTATDIKHSLTTAHAGKVGKLR